MPNERQLKKFIRAWVASERDDSQFAALVESSEMKFWHKLAKALSELIKWRSIQKDDKYQVLRYELAYIAQKKIKDELSSSFESALLRTMVFGMDADDEYPRFIVKRLLHNYDPTAKPRRFSAKTMRKIITMGRRMGPTLEELKRRTSDGLNQRLRDSLDDDGELSKEWLRAFDVVCSYATEQEVEESPVGLFQKAQSYTKAGDAELTKLINALMKLDDSGWDPNDCESVIETVSAHASKVSSDRDQQNAEKLREKLNKIVSDAQVTAVE